MNKIVTSDQAAKPFSHYASAVETAADCRMLHVSGQVGVSPDGILPQDITAQHENAWRNVFALLDAADMDKQDIVDVTAIITDHSQIATYRVVRDRMLDGHQTASTLIVAGLANPAWKVEIRVTAAKSD